MAKAKATPKTKADANDGDSKASADAAEPEIVWISTESGYDLGLDGATIKCRNAKGKVLASVPKKARDTPEAEELTALRDWLARHDQNCRETVETWMVGSLPIPLDVLISVWPDPSWRTLLEDAIAAPIVKTKGKNKAAAVGVADQERAGFLRGADPKKGLGVVDLDGETVWVKTDQVVLPHPVVLDEIDDFRSFAAEIGIEQAIPQLMRTVYERPDDLDPKATTHEEYAGGRFAELRHAAGRANSNGYRVRGGYVTTACFDGDRRLDARYWIGSDDPAYETETGSLLWVDSSERAVPLVEVGPVAWSEGARMAATIFAGRVTEDDAEDQ